MTCVVLGLGSNVGNRIDHIEDAIAMLGQHLTIEHISPYYESPALLPEGAPEEWNIDFINAVVVIETQIPPHQLLTGVKNIEADLGRQDRGRWGPREIDIDILSYGVQIINQEGLQIPHPGIVTRDFVLVPWCDVMPDWKHPVAGRSIKELCNALPSISCILFEGDA